MIVQDTGCSNLFSFTAAIRRLGYQPIVSCDPEVILQADTLFLLGIFTARVAMDQLQERELIALVKVCTQSVLTICLGMQLLSAASDENGGVNTLGIIDAPALRMPDGGLPCPIQAETRSD